MDFERRRVTHPGGGVPMTKQADKDATDINRIVGNYRAHGVLPVQRGQEPMYGDFASGFDLHEAMNRIIAAERDFEALPAEIRKAVNNDPREFLDHLADDEKRERLLELGLDPERARPAPEPGAPAAPAPEPAPAPAPEPAPEG